MRIENTNFLYGNKVHGKKSFLVEVHLKSSNQAGFDFCDASYHKLTEYVKKFSTFLKSSCSNSFNMRFFGAILTSDDARNISPLL
jgi:hypothetical protein